MTVIRRTNPLGELVSLRHAMDRLFEDSFVRPRSAMLGDEHSLALDIRTNGDEVVVEAALPGIQPEDVDVSVLGDTLTISASHRAETMRDDDGYSYREIRRGSFSRTITLPSGVKADAASANFENGMLTLHLPKAEEARARQIPVTVGAAPSGQAIEGHSVDGKPATEPGSEQNAAEQNGAEQSA